MFISAVPKLLEISIYICLNSTFAVNNLYGPSVETILSSAIHCFRQHIRSGSCIRQVWREMHLYQFKCKSTVYFISLILFSIIASIMNFCCLCGRFHSKWDGPPAIMQRGCQVGLWKLLIQVVMWTLDFIYAWIDLKNISKLVINFEGPGWKGSAIYIENDRKFYVILELARTSHDQQTQAASDQPKNPKPYRPGKC